MSLFDLHQLLKLVSCSWQKQDSTCNYYQSIFESNQKIKKKLKEVGKHHVRMPSFFLAIKIMKLYAHLQSKHKNLRFESEKFCTSAKSKKQKQIFGCTNSLKETNCRLSQLFKYHFSKYTYQNMMTHSMITYSHLLNSPENIGQIIRKGK